MSPKHEPEVRNRPPSPQEREKRILEALFPDQSPTERAGAANNRSGDTK